MVRSFWVFFLCLVGLGLLVSGAELPLAVIHEFGQGQAGYGEWVEILVVGTSPGTTVDLRGWVLRDLQGTGRGGVWLRFTENPLWEKVPAGTLIVIYNAGDRPNLPEHFPKDDLDPSDFLLVLPARTGEYFTLAQWGGFGNAGDCILLEDSQGNPVFGLCYGDKTGQALKLGEVGRSTAGWYTGSDPLGIFDAKNWVAGPDAPGGSTPGAPNSEENVAWITYLRTPPKD